MVKNYFKVAWRNLMKNTVFSIINIFGLSIGLASCMLIVLYLYIELSYDTYHKDIKRLYQVGSIFNFSGKEERYVAWPAVMAANMKQDFPEIAQTARLLPFNLFGEYQTLIQYTQPDGRIFSFYETKGSAADHSFFQLFAYHFIEGNPSMALNKPNSIVISKDIADKIFKGQTALNKVIRVRSSINGDHDCAVSGVFLANDQPSHIDSRFFISFYGGAIEDRMKGDGDNMTFDNMYTSYLLLKPGTDPKQMEAKFPAFIDKYSGKDLKVSGFSRKAFLIPVKDIHLHADMVEMSPSGSVTYLYMLGSIAIFILVIASINFMNLSTARSSKRSSEVGIRKVLGAEKKALVLQFLGESLLMALISFVFAVVLLVLLLPVFKQVYGQSISLTGASYILMFGFFSVLSLITGLLAGSYPAFYLSSFKPISVLKGKFSNSMAAASLRKGLVVFQFVISAVLITGTFIISSQMQFLRSTDMGFSKDQQIIIPLKSKEAKKMYGAFKNELSQNKQVLSVGASAYYPGISNPSSDNFHKEGQNVHSGQDVRINHVDDNYLQTLEIKPVAGRLFSPDFIVTDTNDRVILNEDAIKKIGFGSPQAAIGKKIYNVYKGKAYSSEIVGVVKDFHFEDLHLPITPYAFYLNDKAYYNYAIVHGGKGDIHALLQSIENTWRQLDPGEPFVYSFLNEDFQKNYSSDERLSSIVGHFSIIAVLISCLGLFGLAAFSAEQRSKEISVRKVLGASVTRIVGLLSKDFLQLVILGVLIAIPVAWILMHRWLESFTSHIRITWLVFALTTLIAMTIAFLTISFQAIRAALVNPAKNLKSE